MWQSRGWQSWQWQSQDLKSGDHLGWNSWEWKSCDAMVVVGVPDVVILRGKSMIQMSLDLLQNVNSSHFQFFDNLNKSWWVSLCISLSTFHCLCVLRVLFRWVSLCTRRGTFCCASATTSGSSAPPATVLLVERWRNFIYLRQFFKPNLYQ